MWNYFLGLKYHFTVNSFRILRRAKRPGEVTPVSLRETAKKTAVTGCKSTGCLWWWEGSSYPTGQPFLRWAALGQKGVDSPFSAWFRACLDRQHRQCSWNLSGLFPVYFSEINQDSKAFQSFFDVRDGSKGLLS